MELAGDPVWIRIMRVQEQFNGLEEAFAAIPDSRKSWWLRWCFRRAVDEMIEVRGAHSHGASPSDSERRLPWLERAAHRYTEKLVALQTISEGY